MSRDDLVREMQPLVYRLASSVARRLPEGVYEWDDLVSCAQLGLVEAACSYDETVGEFAPYAQQRIRGAVIDGLRQRGMYPRSVYEFRKKSTEAIRGLEMKLGRAPTEDEAATSMGLDVDEFRTRKQYVESLEDSILPQVQGESNNYTDETDHFGRWEMGQDVASAMRDLPERERIVLYCIFWLGMTQASISELLGVNGARISQLKLQALSRLRSTLDDYREE